MAFDGRTDHHDGMKIKVHMPRYNNHKQFNQLKKINIYTKKNNRKYKNN